MNLDFLESFRVFADTLNFTHAAKLRHLSQPALHKQIRALQSELGAELYLRVGRNLELTGAGLRLARLAIETTARIEECRSDLRNETHSPRFSLAAGRGAYLYLLGRGIQRFVKGSAQLELLTRDCPGTLSALQRGQAQLGVTVLRELPEGFSGEVIREVVPHLVVAQSHVLANR
ncbi:MAG: LysR family transcriptional regulator [Kofleriaceae bacterium]|nr:LysR family transcriptional regulator [Kofleriaceae bacterium]